MSSGDESDLHVDSTNSGMSILCNSYNMGTRDLPDIYAQARGRRHIYQATAHVMSSIYHFRHTIKICPNMKVTAHPLYVYSNSC